MNYKILFVFFLSIFAGPLQAKWHRASSEHFVVYADDKASDIQEFAQNLEKYHSAMELITGREVGIPSPSNRVVIFAVGSARDVRKLAGPDSKNVAGFYVPRAGASRAFVQDIRNKKGYPDFSTVALLHEYAHHFLISSSRHAMPRWLSEGAAEFFASASFEGNGGVQIGRPAMHRAAELAYASEVSIEELLDPDLYEKRRRDKYDAFYGMSWALFHYLSFEESRKGQLTKYWELVREGQSSIDAAKNAFGDIDQLDREVSRYLHNRKMYSYNLRPDQISYGPVKIEQLAEGEAEMMEVRIRSQRGVNRELAEELVVLAREVAEKYDDDPGVLTALAEAEFDAGNDGAAIAAADKALAKDPSRTNAYVQKGYALFRLASEADDREAAFKDAMAPFSALNKIENDHPLPLIFYYRSFIERGVAPSEQAKAALERASELSPFDQGLAVETALMLASEGQIKFARSMLKPIASSPHIGSLGDYARETLDELVDVEEGVKWTPTHSSPLETPEETDEQISLATH
ncbi:DUF1570 domain-containing protein [Qipengyuania flava]|nr:DUF1570 domain-containing protein [Qipengyuania flava]